MLIAGGGQAADLSVGPSALKLGATERVAALTVMSSGPKRAALDRAAGA
ncbi:hypothetical protein [Cypionkella sp.]